MLLFDFFDDDSNTSAVNTFPLKEDAANGFDEFLCVTDSCLLVLKILSRIDDTDKFAMFNILSYMSNKLLGEGNTAAASEEIETEAPASSPIEKDREEIEITYENNRGFGDSGRLSIYKTIIPTMQREPLRLLIGCLNRDAMKYTSEILEREILNFHNTFLQVLCLTGVPGLLLVLALCVLLGRRVVRVIYSDAPVTISILALMLVGIFSYNMLEVNLFYIMDVSTYAAYTAAGAVLAYTYERDEESIDAKKPE